MKIWGLVYNKSKMVKGKQIDPEMDMTKDMDFLTGSRGISYFFTSIEDIPKDLFKRYVKGKNFLDIGCGDGRIISLAMLCGAKKYRGIEIDEQFIKSSTMQRFIKRGDLCEIDLSNYNVLYYFLGSDLKSEPELIENLKKFEGVLIVYHRKVTHRLQVFQDNLFNIGFEEVESTDYLKIYERRKSES